MSRIVEADNAANDATHVNEKVQIRQIDFGGWKFLLFDSRDFWHRHITEQTNREHVLKTLVLSRTQKASFVSRYSHVFFFEYKRATTGDTHDSVGGKSVPESSDSQLCALGIVGGRGEVTPPLQAQVLYHSDSLSGQHPC